MQKNRGSTLLLPSILPPSLSPCLCLKNPSF
uniref:Uncharacterized protein n=1 Tax=Arundo donax TaxID=35708 RepID=A0A0A9CB45_ARUDO